MISIDSYFLNHFSAKRFPRWQLFWNIFSDAKILAIVMYVLPVLYLFFFAGNWSAIFKLTGSVIASIVVGYVLKAIILRPRPHNHITYLGKSDSSFPSLHTLCAFNLAFLLSNYFPQIGITWYVYACLVGMARMYVQVHYFTDVIGGLVLGTCLAWGILNLL